MAARAPPVGRRQGQVGGRRRAASFLAGRPDGQFGGRPAERETIARLHATKKGMPKGGLVVEALGPLARVVDEILWGRGEVEH